MPTNESHGASPRQARRPERSDLIDWKTIREKAGPYPQGAFEFVRQGLEHTAQMVHGPEQEVPQVRADEDPDAESKRHVSGQQLCLGLKDLAVRKYGRLARLVLARWSIRSTDDFGRIVFAMIDAGLLRKTDADSIGDFSGVYDFDEVFDASDN